MDDLLTHIFGMLIGRASGPLAFRLILQPSVAAFLAIRAGMRDARAGRPAFGWTVTTDPTQRRALIGEGWRDIGKLFTAAVLIDLLYELIVFRWIYPGQALIVATVLAVPSYFFIRGLANRLASCLLSSRPGPVSRTSAPGRDVDVGYGKQ